MNATAIGHRPWAVPDRPWAMRMRWCDLLFAHWAVDASVLRKLIPAGLELDLFQGRAYVGVVPFRMQGVTPRWLPAAPGLDAFPELNLRTYVTVGGRPGVWFFSLDAGQKLAVRIARRFFHLPYFDARFEIQRQGSTVEYSAVRTHRNAPAASFRASYRAIGDVFHSAPGTLEAWLTERYCLYAANTAGCCRCPRQHSRRTLRHRTARPTRVAPLCKTTRRAGVAGGNDLLKGDSASRAACPVGRSVDLSARRLNCSRGSHSAFSLAGSFHDQFTH